MNLRGLYSYGWAVDHNIAVFIGPVATPAELSHAATLYRAIEGTSARGSVWEDLHRAGFELRLNTAAEARQVCAVVSRDPEDVAA
jgi:hypothetical protein